MRAVVRYIDRVTERGWTATTIAGLYLGILGGFAIALGGTVFAIVYLALTLVGVP